MRFRIRSIVAGVAKKQTPTVRKSIFELICIYIGRGGGRAYKQENRQWALERKEKRLIKLK